MAEFYKKYVEHNLWFKILSAIAVLLLIASFIVPPLGIIEPSVIAGVGEIFAFAALWTLIKAIDKGKTASVSHGQTTISVSDKDNKNG